MTVPTPTPEEARAAAARFRTGRAAFIAGISDIPGRFAPEDFFEAMAAAIDEGSIVQDGTVYILTEKGAANVKRNRQT